MSITSTSNFPVDINGERSDLESVERNAGIVKYKYEDILPRIGYLHSNNSNVETSSQQPENQTQRPTPNNTKCPTEIVNRKQTNTYILEEMNKILASAIKSIDAIRKEKLVGPHLAQILQEHLEKNMSNS